jgi:hypothetical protein
MDPGSRSRDKQESTAREHHPLPTQGAAFFYQLSRKRRILRGMRGSPIPKVGEQVRAVPGVTPGLESDAVKHVAPPVVVEKVPLLEMSRPRPVTPANRFTR